MSEVASKVTAIIVDKLGVEESQVIPEASFTNDLGADSLDIVDLIQTIEDEYDLSIPDEAVESIKTVGEIKLKRFLQLEKQLLTLNQ